MRKFRIIAVIILCVMSIAGAAAQTDSVRTSVLKTIGRSLDKKAHLKYDASFIEVPDQPWRVILRSKMDENKIDFITNSEWWFNDELFEMDMTMTFDSKLNMSTGVWVGYRGLGAAYFYKPGKKPGINFAVSATAAKFGINFRIRDMLIEDVHLKAVENTSDSITVEEGDYQFGTPINVRSLFLNGYYVFNGRRYSQGAAYNQVVIQRKSAGSLLLGVTAYASMIDLNTSNRNAGVINVIADSLGYISLGKISIGLGYGYNWVPARGWTVNAMVMPNISISDNIVRTKYDCNYNFLGVETEQTVEDYGAWDSENHKWQNGKTHKPMWFNDEVQYWWDDIDMWQVKEESTRTQWAFNLDLRMGVAYCWKRFFVSANAIFEHYKYGHEQNRVDLIDWYATFSLGIRL